MRSKNEQSHANNCMMNSIRIKSMRQTISLYYIMSFTKCAQTIVIVGSCLVVFLCILIPHVVLSSSDVLPSSYLIDDTNTLRHSSHYHHQYHHHNNNNHYHKRNHHDHQNQHRGFTQYHDATTHNQRAEENQLPDAQQLTGQNEHIVNNYAPIPQQVPSEQLSIVVNSNSDNSYVSASPIEILATSSDPKQHRLLQQQLHQHAHHQFQGSKTVQQNVHHWLHKKIKANKSVVPNRTSKTRYGSDQNVGSEKDVKHVDYLRDDEPLVDRGHISTTATTTPRIDRDRIRRRKQNTVQDKVIQYHNGHTVKSTKQVDETLGSNYHIESRSIIKTKDSIREGAIFLNYTLVTSLNACLVECWITDSCDTAIYQETPVEFNTNQIPVPKQMNSESNNNEIDLRDDDQVGYSEKLLDVHDEEADLGFFICYLFQCSKTDGFKCQFSPHNYYTSATSKKSISINKPMIGIIQETTTASSKGVELGVQFSSDTVTPKSIIEKTDTFSYYPEGAINIDQKQELTFTCEVEQFKCLSTKQCIPNNQICDGIVQCSDQSDEMSCIDDMKLFDENKLKKVAASSPHYSHIIDSRHTVNHINSINRKHWPNSHIASITIEQEFDGEYDGRGGFKSAITAIMFGIAITGMLVMIVAHKMKTIQERVAHKGHRKSLVPDTEFLTSTIPI